MRRRRSRLNGKRLTSHRVRWVSCGDGVPAVVVTPVRRVTEMVVVLPRAMLAGVTLQVALAGAPVQVKVAVPGVVAAEVRRSG